MEGSQATKMLPHNEKDVLRVKLDLERVSTSFSLFLLFLFFCRLMTTRKIVHMFQFYVSIAQKTESRLIFYSEWQYTFSGHVFDVMKHKANDGRKGK